eukprot:577142_1
MSRASIRFWPSVLYVTVHSALSALFAFFGSAATQPGRFDPSHSGRLMDEVGAALFDLSKLAPNHVAREARAKLAVIRECLLRDAHQTSSSVSASDLMYLKLFCNLFPTSDSR